MSLGFALAPGAATSCLKASFPCNSSGHKMLRMLRVDVLSNCDGKGIENNPQLHPSPLATDCWGLQGLTKRCSCFLLLLIIESQNHKGWKRTQRSLSPTPAHSTMPNDHVPHCYIPTALEYLQGRWPHHLPGLCSSQWAALHAFSKATIWLCKAWSVCDIKADPKRSPVEEWMKATR